MEVRNVKLRSGSFPVVLFYFCFFFADIVFSELIVRIYTLGSDSGVPIFMILFALGMALLLSVICAAFGKTVRKILSFVLTVALLLVFAVQLVYYTFCDSFMSIAQIGMGGDALTHFGEAAMLQVVESAAGLIWLLIPLLLLILFTVLGVPNGKKTSFGAILIAAALFLVLHFGAVACLPLGGAQIYSPQDIYNDTFILGMSVRNFGVLTSLRLEIREMLFGSEGGGIVEVPEDDTPDTTDVPDIPGTPSVSDTPDAPPPPPPEYDYNVTDVDFDSLIKAEKDKRVKTLHEYFAAQSGTKQNAYTGMFEGYNLIVICAESFSHHVIDKDRTPALYKLASEGFIFTDYYNTVCDNTSNGEYALLTGLIPDTSLLGKGWTTFYSYNSLTSSKNNYLPFCLGNQFRSIGASAYAVHNHTASYYGRNKTHPNLGYKFIAFGQGLKAVETYPTSDLSMLEQTLPTLLTKDANGEVAPFHAYFLTFSGHMPYTFGYNDMADKYRLAVQELPYSGKTKAYIACHMELEYAIQYLLEELEKAGALDNTLIALTNDHYPYPLDLDHLGELAGQTMDPQFDKYRSALLLWSGSMEEPITVDTTCCSLDVLPTLSNLLGLPYDSRLLMGKDVFAEGEHIAVLADRSFVTDKLFFNCVNGEVTLRNGITELPEGYLDKYTALVKNKFTLSTEILYTDYYAKVYGK